MSKKTIPTVESGEQKQTPTEMSEGEIQGLAQCLAHREFDYDHESFKSLATEFEGIIRTHLGHMAANRESPSKVLPDDVECCFEMQKYRDRLHRELPRIGWTDEVIEIIYDAWRDGLYQGTGSRTSGSSLQTESVSEKDTYWLVNELNRIGLPNWKGKEGEPMIHTSQAVRHIVSLEDRIKELQDDITERTQRETNLRQDWLEAREKIKDLEDTLKQIADLGIYVCDAHGDGAECEAVKIAKAALEAKGE